jgi:kynurenine formamidase
MVRSISILVLGAIIGAGTLFFAQLDGTEEMPPTAQGLPPLPREIVDLSPTIGEDFAAQYLGNKMLRLFGLRERTPFDHLVTEEPFYVAMSYVTLWTHGGPHHDPPSHVIAGAAPSDSTPLDQFYGPAHVIDFRHKARDEGLTAADFQAANVQAGEIVIAVVGYEPPIDPEEYPRYPFLSGEAAEYLATLPVKAFATDMCCLMGPADLEKRLGAGLQGSENVLPEHYAFMSRGIPAIEALFNADRLIGEENVVFIGFPLKLENGTGGLMRAAAFLY